MKHILYADVTIRTHERVADLVIAYATLLAQHVTADTIAIPCRSVSGAIEEVALLIGPASQLTVWSDPEPFDGDIEAAVADLEARIAHRSTGIATDELPIIGRDHFEDLDD